MLPSALRSSATRRAAVHSARLMTRQPLVSPLKMVRPAPPAAASMATKAQKQKAKAKPAEEPEAVPGAQEAKLEEPEPVQSTEVPSLDFSPIPAQEQRTGARSSKGSLSQSEKKRRFMTRLTLALVATAIGAHAVYMGREWEEEELKAKKLKPEDAPSSRWGRTKSRFADIFDFFNQPAWPELLPPPYPPPHQKPYTLLLSLDDLLITSTWDRQHGWRTAKRPGVDYFLAYISQFYEVVIFTTQPSYTAEPILAKLDRYGFFINYRLYREATRSTNGKIVKDLSYLNRDLSKVVLLDTDPEHVSTHPENAVILPKWKGDSKDKGLIGVIPFLESIAIFKPADVRPILKAYEGKDVAVEWAKRETEMKEKHVQEWKSKNKSTSSGPSFGSLVGLSSQPSVPKGGAPPMYLEAKRAEAQKQYLEEQKYIRDHKDELEKLLEQDQAAMAAAVPGNLWEAIDQFRGVAPPPPAGAPTPAGAAGAPVGSVAAATAQPPSSSSSSQTKA